MSLANLEEKKDDNAVLTEGIEMFRLQRVDDRSKTIDVFSKRDEKGDYPAVFFELPAEGDAEPVRFALSRDELAAITFALAREDQRDKLLSAKFREYTERLVRLVVVAKTDIKAGQPVIIWRKERVPVEGFNYTKG